MTQFSIPPEPFLTAFGEPVVYQRVGETQGTTLEGVVSREVLLEDGNLQHYGTVVDFPVSVNPARHDLLVIDSDHYEVTRVFQRNDPAWVRCVVAARRGMA